MAAAGCGGEDASGETGTTSAARTAEAPPAKPAKPRIEPNGTRVKVVDSDMAA